MPNCVLTPIIPAPTWPAADHPAAAPHAPNKDTHIRRSASHRSRRTISGSPDLATPAQARCTDQIDSTHSTGSQRPLRPRILLAILPAAGAALQLTRITVSVRSLVPLAVYACWLAVGIAAAYALWGRESRALPAQARRRSFRTPR